MKRGVGLAVCLVLGVGCPGPDPTQLASGLNDPLALMVVGNTLFWIEDASSGNGLNRANSAIRSMAITGGKVTTVLSQANLDGNLASDGTSLYFSFTPGGSMSGTVASCGLDGSNVKTLDTSLQTSFSQTAGSSQTQMWVVNGNLIYLGMALPPALALNLMYALPIGGGTPAIISQLPPEPMDASQVQNAFSASGDGVFFSWLDVSLTGMSNSFLSQIPPGGGSPSNFIDVPTSSVSATSLPIPSAANLTVVGSSVFFLIGDPTTDWIILNSAPLGGGTPTVVSTFTQHASSYLVGDSSGLYMDQSVVSNKGGIFAISLSGTATPFVTDQLGLSTSVGHDRNLALDSKNLYWVAGGFNSGQGTIHAKAR